MEDRVEIQMQKALTEQQYRLEALANAVRHRIKEESPSDVVVAAEMYYKFLRGIGND